MEGCLSPDAASLHPPAPGIFARIRRKLWGEPAGHAGDGAISVPGPQISLPSATQKMKAGGIACLAPLILQDLL
jgi:hypothetical protein